MTVVKRYAELTENEQKTWEEKRKKQAETLGVCEYTETDPFTNELRHDYGFFQIGPFLINEEYGKLELAYLHAFNQMHLHFIGIKEPRKGKGSELMNILCKLADRYQYELVLQVDPSFGVPKHVLVDFYQRFGFTWLEEELIEMSRKPKKRSGVKK